MGGENNWSEDSKSQEGRGKAMGQEARRREDLREIHDTPRPCLRCGGHGEKARTNTRETI